MFVLHKMKKKKVFDQTLEYTEEIKKQQKLKTCMLKIKAKKI